MHANGLLQHLYLTSLPLFLPSPTLLFPFSSPLHCHLVPLCPPFPNSFYLQQRQFPARPQGLFPVCPGAGGNLSRETNCSVSASCEHLAQPGMLSRGYTSGDRVQPPTYTDMCTLASIQQTCTWTTYTLTPVLPSALYNHGPQGNVM